MTSTVFDSELLRDMFGTVQMRAIFSDSGYLKRCLQLEAGRARHRERLAQLRPHVLVGHPYPTKRDRIAEEQAGCGYSGY